MDSGFGFGIPLPGCPVCGAAMTDPELHQRFHDGLRETARRVFAPDMSPEEYEAAIREIWDREHGQEAGR
jgi:hypothetical protein